jgi:hypothetical protein
MPRRDVRATLCALREAVGFWLVTTMEADIAGYPCSVIGRLSRARMSSGSPGSGASGR